MLPEVNKPSTVDVKAPRHAPDLGGNIDAVEKRQLKKQSVKSYKKSVSTC